MYRYIKSKFTKQNTNINAKELAPPYEQPLSYEQSQMQAAQTKQADMQSNHNKYITLGLDRFKSMISQLLKFKDENPNNIYHMCVPEWYNDWDSYDIDNEITGGLCKTNSYINAILNTEFKTILSEMGFIHTSNVPIYYNGFIGVHQSGIQNNVILFAKPEAFHKGDINEYIKHKFMVKDCDYETHNNSFHDIGIIYIGMLKKYPFDNDNRYLEEPYLLSNL